MEELSSVLDQWRCVRWW